MPLNTVFDLDQIAPVPVPGAQSAAERRLRLAIDKIETGRQPQMAYTRLIEGAEPQLLRAISDNSRMHLLAGLRPMPEGDAVPAATQMARMKIYANLEFGETFQVNSRDLGQRIARHFIGHRPPGDLAQEWASLNEDQRLDVVVELLHAYGHESGFKPPCRIETEDLPPDEFGRVLHAQYDLKADTLMLNTNLAAGWGDPAHVLASAGHEATHKMQSDMGVLLFAEQKPELIGEDPSSKALFRDDDERAAAWYFFDNLRFGHIDPAISDIGYRYQPREVHARLVEGAIKQTLNRHMVLGADNGLITGVSNDDLAALGIDPDKIRTGNQPPKRRLI